jgi:hypothetical protein
MRFATEATEEIPMRCNFRGCTKKARWIVDDNGVDTNLCAEHLDEFKAVQKKMNEERDRASMLQYGSV